MPELGPWATHLGEPEKILHEQAGVGVIDLHHGDLVFMGHQDVVVLVEDGCQVEAPAWKGRQTSVSAPAASFISQRVSLPRADKVRCPRSQLLQQPVEQESNAASKASLADAMSNSPASAREGNGSRSLQETRCGTWRPNVKVGCGRVVGCWVVLRDGAEIWVQVQIGQSGWKHRGETFDFWAAGLIFTDSTRSVHARIHL